VFTVGNTKYAGVAQQFDYNYSASSFDDFTVSSVPAPGAIALLGLAGLAGRRRR
jgi:MYXO-CTERM domain-containing protein